MHAQQVPWLCHARHSFDKHGALFSYWPGLVLTVRAKGRALSLCLQADGVHFDLYLNGRKLLLGGAEQPSSLFVKRKQEVRIELDSQQVNELQLCQRSESLDAPVIVHSAMVEQGQFIAPKFQAKPLIEWIGDSYFVGYGNFPQHSDLASSTNTQASMAVLCSDILHCNWRMCARSGHGMVRNYGGKTEYFPLPHYLEQSQQRGEVESVSSPDVVVLNLGCNDFSTPLQTNDPYFANESMLKEAFYQAYNRLINTLLDEQPKREVVLVAVWHYAMQAHAEALRNVYEHFSAHPRVNWVELPPSALSGMDAHPSAEEHRTAAQYLAEQIAPLISPNGLGIKSSASFSF